MKNNRKFRFEIFKVGVFGLSENQLQHLKLVLKFFDICLEAFVYARIWRDPKIGQYLAHSKWPSTMQYFNVNGLTISEYNLKYTFSQM